MRCKLALLTLLMLSGVFPSFGSETEKKQGKIMWEAFTCHQYAMSSEKLREAHRLFYVGYKAGQIFVDAVNAKRITLQELSEALPEGYDVIKMNGPNADFVIGRVFEIVTRRAENGIKLDVDTPDELSAAKKMYELANCEQL